MNSLWLQSLGFLNKEEMNKNVFRRSLGIWLLAIGLLVYSYFQAIPGLHSLEPPQKLYKQGLVYRSQDSEDVLAVKVLDIDLIPVKTDEAQYYLIKHDYGVTAMKTTFNTVYSMLKMKDRFPNQEIPLESGGFYLSVKVIPEVENRRKGGMKILNMKIRNTTRFSLEDIYYISRILWNI